MRSKKAMLAALVVSAGAVVGIGQVTNTFPVVGSSCACPTPTFPPQNTVAPTISGNIQVAQGVIAATDGTWTHTPTSFTYNWQSSPTGAGSWSDLGDTDNNYILVVGDVGNYIRIQVTGTNAQGSAVANSNVLGPIVAQGGGGGGGGSNIPSDTLANVWISATGSDAGASCVRSAVAIVEPTPHTAVCKSFLKAYQLARCGDNVLVDDDGVFGAQNILYTSSKTVGSTGCSGIDSTHGCHLSPGYPSTGSVAWPDGTTQAQNLSQCVFISAKNGDTPHVGCPTLGCTPLIDEASYVYLANLTLVPDCPDTTHLCQGGIYVTDATSRTGSANCTNAVASEVVFDNTDGGASWFNSGPTDNVAIVNSDFGPAWTINNGSGLSSQVNNCLNPNSSNTYLQTARFIFKYNNMHDYVNPSGTSGVHGECIHFNGAKNWTISDNTFYNCTYNQIAFQSDGNSHITQGSVNYGLVENNVFADGCDNTSVSGAPTSTCQPIEGGGVTLRCGNLDDTENIIFRYNTMYQRLNFTLGNPTLCQVGTLWPMNHGIQIYANITTSTSTATGYPTGYTSSGYNVFSGFAGGGTGDVNAATSIASLFNNSAYPTRDYTISGTTYADTASCAFGAGAPSTDITGVTRPQGSGCTPGAYEK